MAWSTTRNHFVKAAKASTLSPREVADRVGLTHIETLMDMLEGKTQVPLSLIPALAGVFSLDERYMLLLAVEEYHPGVYEVLVDVMGIPRADAELGIHIMFRLGTLRLEYERRHAFVKALESLVDFSLKG